MCMQIAKSIIIIAMHTRTHTHTGEEHIYHVAESLQNVAHQYKGIGRVLRLPYNRVEQIYIAHKTDFFGGTTAIVAEYITQAGKYKYGPPTMWKIVAAVSNSGGGNNHLQAKKIATKYPRKLILQRTKIKLI